MQLTEMQNRWANYLLREDTKIKARNSCSYSKPNDMHDDSFAEAMHAICNVYSFQVNDTLRYIIII